MNSYLASLNNKQKEAVYQPLHPVMVLAGPGTGKTKTLTSRIMIYLEEPYNIRPERIIAVTFTNKAAEEMKDRLCQYSNKGAKVIIKTIHSFCLYVLQHHGSHVYINSNLTIADELMQFRLLSKCVNSQDVKSLHHVRDILSQYRFGVKHPLAVSEEVVLSWLNKYENELIRHHMIDFDQMITKTHELFENFPEVLGHYRNMFDAILIDEFQDVDPLQYSLLSLLAKENQNIFVVGDDDQSIYSFRGSSLESIQLFEEDFSCETIVLNKNYRSTEPIIRLSTSFMEKHRFIDKQTKPGNTFEENPIPFYHEISNEKEEEEFIVHKVKEYYDKGIPYSDIAVMYPTNYLTNTLESSFIASRIPYNLDSTDSIFECKHLQLLLVSLSLVYWNLSERENNEEHIFLTQDLAYEQFFLSFSGLSYKTFKLIKYHQREQNFYETIHALCITKKNWGLDITQSELSSITKMIDNTSGELLGKISEISQVTLVDIIHLLIDLIPDNYKISTFEAFCHSVLEEPFNVGDVKTSTGLLFYYLLETKQTNIEIYAGDYILGRIMKDLFLEACKQLPNVLIDKDCISLHPLEQKKTIPYIKFKNPGGEIYFEDGCYEFFKLLQAFVAELKYKLLFNRYIIALPVVDFTINQEVSGLHLTEIASYDIVNDITLSLEDPKYKNKLQTFLTDNPPTIITASMHKIITQSLPRSVNVLDIESYFNGATPQTIEGIIDKVSIIRKKEYNRYRKTALSFLTPLLSLGLYYEHKLFPIKYNWYFAKNTEPLELFKWGSCYFQTYKHSDFIKRLYRSIKAGFVEFTKMVSIGENIYLKNDGLFNLMSLAAYYSSKYSNIFEAMRFFLNDLSFSRTLHNTNIEGVQLSTIHASKGTEYRVCLVGGLEEGILPSSHSLKFFNETGNNDLIEEQRRVLYVAMTRAKQYLHLIHTKNRYLRKNNPSRFLAELNL